MGSSTGSLQEIPPGDFGLSSFSMVLRTRFRRQFLNISDFAYSSKLLEGVWGIVGARAGLRGPLQGSGGVIGLHFGPMVARGIVEGKLGPTINECDALCVSQWYI